MNIYVCIGRYIYIYIYLFFFLFFFIISELYLFTPANDLRWSRETLKLLKARVVC
jgi:hypothetical protein